MGRIGFWHTDMIDFDSLLFRIDPMRPEDIDRVMEIEHLSFSAPWSARAYDYELHYNEMAKVLRGSPQNGIKSAFAEGKTHVVRNRAPTRQPRSRSGIDFSERVANRLAGQTPPLTSWSVTAVSG